MKLAMHTCVICGAVFHHNKKLTICHRCLPSGKLGDVKINDLHAIRDRRARERERWKARMSDPEFREHERLRSLMRYRARKAAK